MKNKQKKEVINQKQLICCDSNRRDKSWWIFICLNK